MLGTPDGRVTARSITRRPEGKRWSKKLIAQRVCRPWCPRESLNPQPAVQRQQYLTRGIVNRLGKTEGCSACQGFGGMHTHACRERLEKLLAQEEEEQQRQPERMQIGSDAGAIRLAGSPGNEASASSVPQVSQLKRAAEAAEDTSMQTDEIMNAVPLEIDDSMPTLPAGEQLPESKRTRTVGGLAVCVIALHCGARYREPGVAAVSVRPPLGRDAGPISAQRCSYERAWEMNELHVYDRVLLSDATGKRVRSKWLDD